MESEKAERKGVSMISPEKTSGKEVKKILFGDNSESIHSLLKQTMAGSMREVIKDELQAWLGLKNQIKKGHNEVQGGTELEENLVEEKEKKEGEILINDNKSPPIIEGDEEEEDIGRMISPMKEIVEEEERQARANKERRTSTRQANQRKIKNYEMDRVARAAKRKEGLEEKGITLQEARQITPATTHRKPEGDGSRRVKRRL